MVRRTLAVFLASFALWAQPGTITTIAGNYSPGLGLPATQIQPAGLAGLAMDGSGNVFVAEAVNRWIRRIDSNGIVQPYAGTGAAVDPPADHNPPDPGAAAPAEPPLAVAAPLALAIDGKEAPIKEAILMPGLVGVYRILATVPADAATSASARVVLSINDIPSPVVTMAIQSAGN